MKKQYDFIIFKHDVLSSASNYIVGVVMWPKFGNCSISMREVIITLILSGFDQKKKNTFFGGVALVKVQ